MCIFKEIHEWKYRACSLGSNKQFYGGECKGKYWEAVKIILERSGK